MIETRINDYYSQHRPKLFRRCSSKVMEEYLPQELIVEYKEAFRMLDKKHIGKISIRDIATVVFSIGIRITEHELLDFVSGFVELHENNLTDNCVGFSQFVATMASIITDCVPEEEVMRIFREFDKDGDGYISSHELRDLLLQLGDDVTENDVQEMMNVADTDGDGRVSLSEFIRVMSCSELPHDQMRECMSMPRLLIETKERRKSSSNSFSSSSLVGAWTEDSRKESVESESHSESDFNSVNSMAGPCPHVRRRRESVSNWINGAPSGVLPAHRFSTSVDTNAFVSSSSCSLASSSSTSTNTRNANGRRRHSSLTKTLKSGRDALIATARTFRKLSR